MDTIGDFLTVFRNAVGARKASFEVSSSRLRIALLRILKNTGYVDNFEELSCSRGHRVVRVTLRYVEGTSSVRSVVRCSRPGCRVYCGARNAPRVLNGLGISILSTSKGLMRDAEARRKNLGGEILCKVW
ncbi:MAG: 30S ribosomal protein S8 [Puniceicoccales bacterium]|jgi:small subunit ribosomal protein S8|nr:30S ribosomal protein S8 [Puniceicoccales bacterium]